MFLKIILLLGIMFVMSIQPMMVISSLIFVTLLYSLSMTWSSSSFWYSYMIVLVLMSGVLVVFTYMMSVLPNESFEVSSLITIIMGLVFFYGYLDYNEFLEDVSLSSMKIWVGFTMSTSLFLVIYLLGIMVIVVWVSLMEKGAIRIG